MGIHQTTIMVEASAASSQSELHTMIEAGTAMERAIAESEHALGNSDRCKMLEQELYEARDLLDRVNREHAANQAALEKQHMKDSSALEMYKKKCESMKLARQKLEERSNAKMDDLQRQLEDVTAKMMMNQEQTKREQEVPQPEHEAPSSPLSNPELGGSEESLGKTQQLNVAMIGAEALMTELQAMHQKLSEEEDRSAQLRAELLEAREDREADAVRQRELEWHEERLPDLAAASEKYLLLQERHDALAAQVDAKTAEANEQAQRADALGSLLEIKNETIEQLEAQVGSLKASQTPQKGDSPARGDCKSEADTEEVADRKEIPRDQALKGLKERMKSKRSAKKDPSQRNIPAALEVSESPGDLAESMHTDNQEHNIATEQVGVEPRDTKDLGHDKDKTDSSCQCAIM